MPCRSTRVIHTFACMTPFNNLAPLAKTKVESAGDYNCTILRLYFFKSKWKEQTKFENSLGYQLITIALPILPVCQTLETEHYP